jgi:predicted Fe-Mo cluster-binding NifX family protein
VGKAYQIRGVRCCIVKTDKIIYSPRIYTAGLFALQQIYGTLITEEIMEKIIVAIGLENDSQLTNDHFGDSIYFDIYEFSSHDIRKIKRIKNLKIEERMHGDPKKANAIGTLLKGTNALAAFRMGPNILRMKKNFVPVIINSRDVEKVKKALMENFDAISKEVNRTGEKNYITLKVKEA